MQTLATTLSQILTALVALEHLYILVLEMFLWTKPRGLKTFRLTPEFAMASQGLAKNQGLYNGFLAAGLMWGLLHPQPDMAFQLKVFFLGCVVTAGVYGALTVNRRIFFMQGVPALLALAVVVASRWQ
jgi:putative membrane protein